MNLEHLSRIARTALTSNAHYQRFFDALRTELPVDRLCAAVQLDPYTAYLPRVAQVDDLEPLLGNTGIYADREGSRTFQVIEEGDPYLVTEQDWTDHADLAFYAVAVSANMKFPVSFGGYPTVLNFWSKTKGAFTPDLMATLEPVVAEVSRSPFKLEPEPVGLGLRKVKALLASREAALKAKAA